MHVQRRGAGHDDEPRHYVGEDAAGDHVQLGGFVLTPSDTFFDHRGLQIELHPRCDRGADHSDGHEQVVVLEQFPSRQLESADGGFDPVGLGQGPGKNVGNVNEGGDQEYFFDALVLTFNHNQPDNDCADRDCLVTGKAEQLKTAGNTGEFAQDVAEVDEQDGDHHEEGDAEAEFFANQVA